MAKALEATGWLMTSGNNGKIPRTRGDCYLPIILYNKKNPKNKTKHQKCVSVHTLWRVHCILLHWILTMTCLKSNVVCSTSFQSVHEKTNPDYNAHMWMNKPHNRINTIWFVYSSDVFLNRSCLHKKDWTSCKVWFCFLFCFFVLDDFQEDFMIWLLLFPFGFFSI